MFVASPAAPPLCRRHLQLLRAARSSFTGPAEFLADPANRAQVGEYLADVGRTYGREVPAAAFGEPPSPALGHSYGEMAETLIGLVAAADDEPVDLLILAFSVHDLTPGRPTAAYLSHVTAGEPMAFALCDQGSAAAFSGLRVVRDYMSSAAVRRALLIVVEQAALPYSVPEPLPSRHQGVAMMLGGGDAGTRGAGATLAGLRQHPGVPPGAVAAVATATLSELAAGHHEVRLIVGDTLAALWTAPSAGPIRVTPPGQPSTGIWWELADELDDPADRPGLVVAADYDAGLRYLCLAAFGDGRAQSITT